MKANGSWTVPFLCAPFPSKNNRFNKSDLQSRLHPIYIFVRRISKVMVDSALFHNGIRSMAGFDCRIHGDVSVCMRAEPDIVIALSVPDEAAAALPQQFPYFLFIFRHYAKATFSRRSTENRTDGRTGRWFRATSSGTASMTRRISSSKDSDSSTRPSISSLVAIQTFPSSSHRKSTTYSNPLSSLILRESIRFPPYGCSMRRALLPASPNLCATQPDRRLIACAPCKRIRRGDSLPFSFSVLIFSRLTQKVKGFPKSAALPEYIPNFSSLSNPFLIDGRFNNIIG